MHETASDLLQHLANAFGVPGHLKDALTSWVESVEERLGGGNGQPRLGRGKPRGEASEKE